MIRFHARDAIVYVLCKEMLKAGLQLHVASND
jgi:hypothetical protein